VIVETGEGTDGFAVGDLVTGTGLYGAFAEEVVVPPKAFRGYPTRRRAHRRGVWRGVPHGRYHTLRVDGRGAGGRRVIVLGAGGGVGLAAVRSRSARRLGPAVGVIGRKA